MISMRDYLINVSILCRGNYNRMIKILKKREIVPNQTYQSEVCVIGDDHYPKSFYRLQYPPLVLFYYGKLELLNDTCISVVGSRECNEYGRAQTEWLVNLLKEKFVIVSGLAKGIDTIAHQSSLKTIGILGCGIDTIYPISNKNLYESMKSDHLIISEFPDITKPLKYHFPWRNRLIAASSYHLFVMSATLKSGTMHTANEAMQLDSNIYCLPYPIDESMGEGCHQLINDGAYVLTKQLVFDILNQ